MTSTTAHLPERSPPITMTGVRAVLVAAVFVLSFISRFEPAPCDIAFVLAFLACLGGGLRLSIALVPLLVLLLLYNVAGLISYIVLPFDDLGASQYLLGLAYTSFSAFFFAAYIAEDPSVRFQQIIKAYWIGATIGATLGLLGYFGVLKPGPIIGEYYNRAVGAYKDPNVYSTWLVLPVVTLLQAFILGTVRHKFIAMVAFLAMVAALFLAFSRGAWINVILSTVLMVSFTYFLSPANSVRMRVKWIALFGIVLGGLVVFFLLSIPEIRNIFLDRFTLVKEYDGGEVGRFGNQLNSIPMLIERPLGFGPYQFAVIFGNAPHNTIINSFASAGWLGGISFVVFMASSLYVGFRTMFIRTPFQPYIISAYSCFVAVAFQGVQIDMEHWRHLYWMVGMVWGFFAASLAYAHTPANWADVFRGWNLAAAPTGDR